MPEGLPTELGSQTCDAEPLGLQKHLCQHNTLLAAGGQLSYASVSNAVFTPWVFTPDAPFRLSVVKS